MARARGLPGRRESVGSARGQLVSGLLPGRGILRGIPALDYEEDGLTERRVRSEEYKKAKADLYKARRKLKEAADLVGGVELTEEESAPTAITQCCD